MTEAQSIVPVVAGFAVFAVAMFLILLRSAWKIAEPNEALIISGFGNKVTDTDALGFKVVTGRGTFVLPGMQRVRKLDLSLHEAELQTDCPTQQGIPVGIRGVAVYKVGDDQASIANAARRFLDQDPKVVDRQVQSFLDGHLRSIIGGMTIEDLIRNRDTLTSETRKAAGTDMEKLGLIIDSLQIQEVADPTGYIKALAAPHVADVQKAARIAQAQADQAATQTEQAAAAQKAQFKRDSEITQAKAQADIDQAKMTASQAGPLAEAQAKQEVTIAATKTAELEAARKEQELQATVRKPADATAYATRVTAEANRDAEISRAEGEARKIELDATARASAVKLTGEAQAAATMATGAADGSAIKAKLMAEADGIAARATALAKNQEAVIAQTLAEKMPEIVKAAADSFGRVGNMTIFDGATGMARNVSELVGLGATLLPVLRKNLTNAQQPQNGEPPAP